MNDKTEEQIAKEREAVEAMRNAKANMTTALERIATLEGALRLARDRMVGMKDYIPKGAYVYDGRKSLHAAVDEDIARLTKALG